MDEQAKSIISPPQELRSAVSVAHDNPTPREIVARFAGLPAYLPVRTRRLPDGLTLGNVISGDLIAVDLRWFDVLGCTSVNGWVTIETPGPEVTAHESTPVHLARKEPVSEPVAAGV